MSFNRYYDQLEGYNYDMTTYDHRTPKEFIPGARRNQVELIKLINRLFEHYSRMLVVRIDLRYKDGIGKIIPLETVQMHRDKLLADRRGHSNEFDDMVGYAWCLEYGEDEGGYHYHLLAFYNGADRRGDIGIGMALRDLWDTITGGYGQCYISNFDKEKLARDGCLGIGMINRNDITLRINLIEKVATYITKKCPMPTIESARTESGEFRTFGKIRMPSPIDPNIPRRGRPATFNGFVF